MNDPLAATVWAYFFPFRSESLLRAIFDSCIIISYKLINTYVNVNSATKVAKNNGKLIIKKIKLLFQLRVLIVVDNTTSIRRALNMHLKLTHVNHKPYHFIYNHVGAKINCTVVLRALNFRIYFHYRSSYRKICTTIGCLTLKLFWKQHYSLL